MTLEFRRAKTVDFKKIVDLDRETWDCFDSDHAWKIWIDYASVFVASNEGRLLGVALLFKTDKANLTVLHKLFVTKNARGHGVGTQLMQLVESELDHTNQDCVLTTSLSERFYLSHGFLLRSTIQGYYLPTNTDNGDRKILFRVGNQEK